ncbi:phage terminase small subunit [Agrobacterium sp. RC10-4-1]|uniref:terminase small subunit n=1 Tax=Agrobacterium sp. RC10-4-1 TaxID=2587039 RepID=UPI0015F8E6B5|nr:terminase small subunit [Agrobacterium sp. RC10-4-1]MBA8799167.1 phage terminase small subunit [Agrobacterium sp. RC10-4-1]
MPVLKNARHETFAQGLAKGLTADEAYQKAGFKPDRGNASRLQQNDSIRQRVSELLEWEQIVERRATEKAVEKLAITKERVLAELAKIGFADIRKAIRWQGTLVTEEDNPDGGDVLVIKNVVTNNVQLISSDEIDDDTAGAIAEISQNATGGIKIKLHDKKGALVDIGKHLGMFVERHEHSGPEGGPIQTETRTWREVLRQETKD